MSKKPRILLWVHELREGLRTALSEHVTLAALAQGAHPAVESISIRDLFEGGARLARFPTRVAPAGWLDDASFREYAQVVPRMGFYPGSDTYETISGGVVEASDIEDWARLHLNNALQVLDGLAIDAVWFMLPPHLAVDQMMALAAKRSGRTVLIVRQLTIVPKFFCAAYRGMQRHQNLAFPLQPWTKGAVRPNLFYMQEYATRPWHQGIAERFGFFWRALSQAGKSSARERMYLAARKRGWWNLMTLLELSDARTRMYALSRWLQRRRARATFAAVEAKALYTAPENYIYFPLHLEPELNTAILGLDFKNQLDAVLTLHDQLPEGWLLLLKENPKQSYLHRGEAYWQRVSQLPNVRFASNRSNSQTLIAGAKLVATITGTSGYEALLVGKACLVFGDAWYADLHGATRYRAGIDLIALAASKPDPAALDASANRCFSALPDGLVFPRNAVAYQDSYDLDTLDRQTAANLIHAMRAVSTDSAAFTSPSEPSG
jgi:hypothetical protein